ncbi:MAG: LamG-like jellyroll fold domain-containing protein [Myxococcota bacterium]
MRRLAGFTLWTLLASCGSDGPEPTDMGTPPDTDADSDSDADSDINETGVSGPIDADNDGVPEGIDCDDDEPLAFPGAVEVPDGIDNDCDTLLDLEELGNAYLFVDNGLHSRDDVAYDLSQEDLTVTMWVRLLALGSTANQLINFGGSVNAEYSLRLTETRNVRLTVRGNLGATATGVSTLDVPFSTWTHVGVVLDRNAQKVRFFIDGQAANDPALDADFFAEGFNMIGPFTIGSTEVENAPSFEVDDVRVFTHALTGEEIRRWALDPQPPTQRLLLDLGFESKTLAEADESPNQSMGNDSRRVTKELHPWAKP